VCAEGFELIPILYGGTGTESMSPNPANVSPDILEAGTQNLPGIVGLAQGAAFIEELGAIKIQKHKKALIKRMSDGLKSIKGITSYIPEDNCGIVAFDVTGLDSQETVHLLSTQYGICARGGFHCSPNLHRYLKTDQTGLIRFSFGIFNKIKEVDHSLNALEFIAKRLV
ncbi:MAG TPA: cysteine desulfurase, partial [Clostridiales bacterium]|nr:cysteine desulfurase [Clostridiales bacterium]